MEPDHDSFHASSQATFPLNYDPSIPDPFFDFPPYHGPENSHGDEGLASFWGQLDELDVLGLEDELERLSPGDFNQLETADAFSDVSDTVHIGEGDSTITEPRILVGPEVTDIPERKTVMVALPKSTLTQPRSLFEGFIPPASESQESDALVSLLEAVKSQEPTGEDHIELDLRDFAIYLNAEKYPYELRPLHHLAIRQQADRFYFDGVISCGGTKFYLKKVAFRQLPIGNYGSTEYTVGDQIWIRSQLNEEKGREIYYKLGSPSAEYRRFYTPFLWIADLAKHVIDYCDYLQDKGRRASLYDFKSSFSTWVLRKHHNSAAFEKWYSANRGSDFRGAIVANAEFIWKEAHGLDPRKITWHRIWKEIVTFDQYKPNLAVSQSLSPDECEPEAMQSRARKSRKQESPPKTVVTPYIYALFAHMNFGKILETENLSATTKRKQSHFLRKTAPIQPASTNSAKREHDKDREAFVESIQPGDVVSTKPDDEGTDTRWKKETSKHYQGEHLWFGLVQKVHQSPRGKRSFDVIWLYRPIDTPCVVMKYPWRNELFLSDNCTCHQGTAKIQGDQVISTHEVEWFGSPSTLAEFFVCQTYFADNSQWTTLKHEHFTCGEPSQESNSYGIGDAVLVQTNPKELKLEACVIEGFFEEDAKRYARLRKLQRRKEVDAVAVNAPPNELVFSQQLIEISPKWIARQCLVRAFRPDENIPAPYNRGGTGDAFFVTHQEVHSDTGGIAFAPLEEGCLENLRQGFNPSSGHTPRSRKLQGLDLFCGGGNFGRGLEDGGGIQMRWANDISKEAIHTYMANCKPNSCTPYLGSVDELLRRAIQGDSRMPQPGEVQFISGGSPCPGFSMLTIDKTTDKQRKNQSLVASFASFVDLYRPHYGLLENVPQMINAKKFRDTCVFSQLVCAIVGLGYQVQIMRLDAWSFGAPQSRSRVFLCFSAPGFRMPKVPEPSHSHPPNVKFQKLGATSCGIPFDTREIVPTPFKFVSAREAVSDLPDIQDGKADYCVGFPDHRLSIGYTARLRKQICQIPIQPWGMNFSKAWWGRPGMPRVMTESERELFPPELFHAERTKKSSKGWGRIHPDDLFNTVATTCAPTDSRVGCANHWQQHRPITILEARRAQGFLDDEVLLGKTANQFRIIGNSVSRQVALALGLAIREAWFGTLLDEPCVPQTAIVSETGTVSRSLELDEEEDGMNAASEAEVKAESSSVSDDLDLFCESTTLQQHSATLTPATSGSNGVSDNENRKRPLVFVEISSKRDRHYVGDTKPVDSPGSVVPGS
ncbi:hypothetical protein F5X99DRAFT_303283 [Biscogniauxia marginata]|nr:hypothetical protein F5X99DRAFT_303283 [Biscogniauxia marginata]